MNSLGRRSCSIPRSGARAVPRHRPIASYVWPSVHLVVRTYTPAGEEASSSHSGKGHAKHPEAHIIDRCTLFLSCSSSSLSSYPFSLHFLRASTLEQQRIHIAGSSVLQMNRWPGCVHYIGPRTSTHTPTDNTTRSIIAIILHLFCGGEVITNKLMSKTLPLS